MIHTHYEYLRSLAAIDALWQFEPGTIEYAQCQSYISAVLMWEQGVRPPKVSKSTGRGLAITFSIARDWGIPHTRRQFENFRSTLEAVLTDRFPDAIISVYEGARAELVIREIGCLAPLVPSFEAGSMHEEIRHLAEEVWMLEKYYDVWEEWV